MDFTPGSESFPRVLAQDVRSSLEVENQHGVGQTQDLVKPAICLCGQVYVILAVRPAKTRSNQMKKTSRPLTHGELLRLKRWNTPTIYNGWEQITRHDPAADAFNLEEVRDFMPQMGPMVGYAVTLIIEPGNAAHKKHGAQLWSDYRQYVAAAPGPKIVVVQDLDKPRVIGSFWGEVNANNHRTLGCVGTITDGAIRDLDEMCNAGFKGLARRLCVGHAHSTPLRWGCAVEVFGRRIEPGQLIHADKHGFLAIPFGEERRLLEAASFMDANECQTMISTARGASGLTSGEILSRMDKAAKVFGVAARKRFKKAGEW
jgi:4-hydroxy-4-methyl-2-oxoglutarate aldolase